jgi:hypothetical protein|tara:strand:- start:536 stop:802 length:267 start_codon:yes stop_codon:yes gene_type:complete
MRITNTEYELIIRSLDAYRDVVKISSPIDTVKHSIMETDILKSKLKKEYNRIAEDNLANGITPDEEELYPSKIYDEYGGAPSDSNKVE